MSSSYMSSRSSVTNRRASQPTDNPNNPGLIHSDLDPAPSPQPIIRLLAVGLILFLALLQFLPASHYRDPSDPLRNWIPFNSHSSPSSSSKGEGSSGFFTANDEEDGMIHVVSWMECLDLKVLAVLANSTLSNSRYPDLVHFHFFTPEGNKDRVSFYKLKVLFPHSNLELHGQEEVKEIIRTATSEADQYATLNFEEIAPFVIPSALQSLRKFIYVSPNLILKGRVEELTGIDLSTYAIAAAEDCSKRLNSYVNSDVLDAIQRSASKPWVSVTPYVKDACMPDLSLLLIDARKLEKEFLQAVLWWRKVLNRSDSKKNPAIALALYNRYLKLSNSWLVKQSASLEITEKSMVILYDGPKIVCSGFGNDTIAESSHGNLWTKYLPSMSNQILVS